MLLSNAIILDVEDARDICKAIEVLFSNKKLYQSVSKESMSAYDKLHGLIRKIDDKESKLDNLIDTVREIDKKVNPDPSMETY